MQKKMQESFYHANVACLVFQVPTAVLARVFRGIIFLIKVQAHCLHYIIAFFLFSLSNKCCI